MCARAHWLGVLIFFFVHFARSVSSATAARLLTNYQETNRVDLWDKVKFQFDHTSFIIHVSHFYWTRLRIFWFCHMFCLASHAQQSIEIITIVFFSRFISRQMLNSEMKNVHVWSAAMNRTHWLSVCNRMRERLCHSQLSLFNLNASKRVWMATQ